MYVEMSILHIRYSMYPIALAIAIWVMGLIDCYWIALGTNSKVAASVLGEDGIEAHVSLCNH